MRNNIEQKSILLLAANPKGIQNLRLQEEEREIKNRLRLAGYGKVPINSTEATRTRDIQQAMLDFKPQIVHFSGHGSGQDGLIFEDVTGTEQLVSSDALANLFKLFSDRVECIVLNACYSQFQAEAIAQHIDYVVGMNQSIGDRAAIEFAVGFYAALGAGESICFAYELGCNAIQLAGVSEHLTPVLFCKESAVEHKHNSLQPDLQESQEKIQKNLLEVFDTQWIGGGAYAILGDDPDIFFERHEEPVGEHPNYAISTIVRYIKAHIRSE
jgi:CHAT domain